MERGRPRPQSPGVPPGDKATGRDARSLRAGRPRSLEHDHAVLAIAQRERVAVIRKNLLHDREPEAAPFGNRELRCVQGDIDPVWRRRLGGGSLAEIAGEVAGATHAVCCLIYLLAAVCCPGITSTAGLTSDRRSRHR